MKILKLIWHRSAYAVNATRRFQALPARQASHFPKIPKKVIRLIAIANPLNWFIAALLAFGLAGCSNNDGDHHQETTTLAATLAGSTGSASNAGHCHGNRHDVAQSSVARAGGLYFNAHSVAFPGSEVRSQISTLKP